MQLFAFQVTICTLNEVIALQETVLGNVNRFPSELCTNSGLFHFLGTEITALNLLAVCLVYNYSHRWKHTTQMVC